MQAIRDARFSSARFHVLKSEQCRAAMDHVAQSFRANDRSKEGPRWRTGTHSTVPTPRLQERRPQGETTVCHHHRHPAAMADLLCAAFFFACRSCEYSKVTGERPTDIITLGNVRFFLKNKESSIRITSAYL